MKNVLGFIILAFISVGIFKLALNKISNNPDNIKKEEPREEPVSNYKKPINNAGRQNMISSLKEVPGVSDASWAQNISLWVVMSNPNAGHNFDEMGYMICNGGVSNFSVAKRYTITFWNPYTNEPITKFRCY